MDTTAAIKQHFINLFHKEPIVIVSPGRVNLIGEHTDYNDGYVMPAAIDKHIIYAIASSDSDECQVHALSFRDSFSFKLEEVKPGEGWKNYILGVVHHLQKQGFEIKGFNAVIDGNIPIGAGLSSSAAIEGGLSFGLTALFNLDAGKMQLAKIGQAAEHTYVGVNCGIMDQFANLYGQKDHLIRLDCRSLNYTHFPFHFPDYKIVLVNTMVSHSLASSEYNVRRRQCEEGVEKLKADYPSINNLRDVNESMLEKLKDKVNEKVYARCRFVVQENKRVLEAGALLQENDLIGFGKLMYEAHEGLSKLYEVSCEELDYLTELTKDREEVIGARMMGGGFGGCTINIVKADKVEDFKAFMKSNYQQRYHKDPDVYITTIEDGVHVVGE